MRAAPGFNTDDAICIQGLVANQEFGIFPGVDIVGDDSDVVFFPQFCAEGSEQCGFSGTYRSPDADATDD